MELREAIEENHSNKNITSCRKKPSSRSRKETSK